MKRFKVNKIRLIDEKDQTRIINDRFLFVYGTVATGKSLFANLISYCLGQKRIEIVEELKPFEKVMIEIETGSGSYVICRSLKQQSAAILCQRGKMENFSEALAEKLSLGKSEEPSNQFSWFLLDKAQIPVVKSFPGNITKSSRPSLVSFRDIFQYCYLSQDRIDSEKPFGLDTFELPKAIDAFEVMFGIKLTELYDKEMELYQTIQRKESLPPKIEYLSEFLESYMLSPIDLTSTIAQEENELNSLNQNIAKFDFDKKVVYNISPKDQLKIIRDAENNLAELLNKKIHFQETLKKWEALLNSYILEQNRLALTARASQLMDSLPFTVCPSCGEPIKEKDPLLCFLCGSTKKYLKEDEETIQIQLKESIQKQNILFEEIEKMKERLRVIEDEIKQEESHLNEIKNLFVERRKIDVDPTINEYQSLCLKAGELKSSLDFNRKILSMLKRLQDLQDEYNKYEREERVIKKELEEIKEKGKRRKEEVIAILTKKLNSIIKDLQIPDVYKSKVTIDPKNYLPSIDGGSYLKVSSGGLKVFFMVSYFLAMLETAFEFKDNYHPKFVIIDSIHKNVSTKELTDKSVIDVFFKKIIEIHNNHEDVQIIVIDNELPDFIINEEKFEKWHFTRVNGKSNGFIK